MTWLSVLLAAAPVVVMLGGLAFFRVRAHVAALVIAIAGFGMPARLTIGAAGFGAAYGLLPIGWIVLNMIFLYQLTEERGRFEILRNSIARVTDDALNIAAVAEALLFVAKAGADPARVQEA